MPSKRLTALLVFLLTISFYIYTLSPSLAWGDGVRLQSEVISGESFVLSEMSGSAFSPDPFPFSKVGITAWDHPLYIVMGHTLVQALPFVDSLWLVNLISAVFGAASITMVFLLGYRFTNSIPASGYAALLLAVSHTFWWHSSTPEVYTLFAFLLLLSIHFYGAFQRTQKTIQLALSAFFLGLAASNHVLAFLAIPALGLHLAVSREYQDLLRLDWRKIVLVILSFLAGFSIFLVQFVRMTGSFSIYEIMGPVVGSTFLGNLGTLSPALLGGSLLRYLLFLILQFSPLGIILGMIGIRKALGSTHPPEQKITSFFVVYVIFGILYRVSDQFAFFLTSYVFFALLIGMGATHVLAKIQIKPRLILSLCLLLTIVATPPLYHFLPRLAEGWGLDDSFLGIPQVGTGIRNGLTYYVDPYKRGDLLAYEFGSETITRLPPNSIVIAEWYTDTDEYFVLRHFNEVMGTRPDLTVMGFPVEDPFSFDTQLVLTVIEDSFPERPVYLASLSDRFYAASKLVELYCIVPENDLYRLYRIEGNGSNCLGIDSITP